MRPITAALIASALLCGCLCGCPEPASPPTPDAATTAPSPQTTADSKPALSEPPADTEPVAERAGCRRLTWSGAPEKLGYKTLDVQLKVRDDDKLITLTWDGGSMRLPRAPKDVRAYDGPWTTKDRGEGRARLNFKAPWTSASGFWMIEGDRKRRRITLEPCTVEPSIDL